MWLSWLMVLALAAPPQVVSVRYQVTRVDPVEREFYGAGQRKPVIGVFSTIYRINDVRVSARVFWAALRPGDSLDAKVRPGPYFARALVASVNLRRKP